LNAADLSHPLSDDEWLTGAAPLVRTSAFAATDLLEPAFFAYMEDVDLSIRLARAGGAIYAVPGAEVVHVGGSTSGGPTSPLAQFLFSRNAWLLLQRQSPRGSGRASWLRFAANTVRRAALFDMNGRTDLARAVMAAISAARLNQFGPPPASFRPAWIESLVARGPWRSIQVMNALARVLDYGR
jgi:GT2 family glycosyltransferase